MVLEAIFKGRQLCEIQCLYENLTSNDCVEKENMNCKLKLHIKGF